jgi:16S rRNA (cytosine1402-N4)-methyltransferase
MVYHIPALLKESIDGLNIQPDGIYVDVTFGGGGHSAEILKRLKKGRLIAFDQDEDAAGNIPQDEKFLFLNQNFRFLKNNLQFNKIKSIDGLIADLGVSFHQFDEPERGFTFRQDAPLDMRMNKQGSLTAADLLNTLDESSLADVFYRFGELTSSRRIAREIVAARVLKPLTTVNDIFNAAGKLAPFRQELLEQALSLLNGGGRLVIISYHSLEDRLVKNFMKTGNFEGEEKKDFYGNIVTPFRIINRKGTTPGEEELAINNRARSARLRIAEKI